MECLIEGGGEHIRDECIFSNHVSVRVNIKEIKWAF